MATNFDLNQLSADLEAIIAQANVSKFTPIPYGSELVDKEWQSILEIARKYFGISTKIHQYDFAVTSKKRINFAVICSNGSQAVIKWGAACVPLVMTEDANYKSNGDKDNPRTSVLFEIEDGDNFITLEMPVLFLKDVAPLTGKAFKAAVKDGSIASKLMQLDNPISLNTLPDGAYNLVSGGQMTTMSGKTFDLLMIEGTAYRTWTPKEIDGQELPATVEVVEGKAFYKGVELKGGGNFAKKMSELVDGESYDVVGYEWKELTFDGRTKSIVELTLASGDRVTANAGVTATIQAMAGRCEVSKEQPAKLFIDGRKETAKGTSVKARFVFGDVRDAKMAALAAMFGNPLATLASSEPAQLVEI